jgi:hypothetical protein
MTSRDGRRRSAIQEIDERFKSRTYGDAVLPVKQSASWSVFYKSEAAAGHVTNVTVCELTMAVVSSSSRKQASSATVGGITVGRSAKGPTA